MAKPSKALRLSQELVNAEQAGDNTQYQHNGQVGDDEKKDAFHEVL
jgi:hypothetical protein